jgi:hypothetical protein
VVTAAAAAPAPEVTPPEPPPAPPPKPPSPYESPEISRLREEAASLLKVQSELYWHNWVAGERLDMAATYSGHERLFSAETVAGIREARKASQGDEAAALAALEAYVAGEVVAQAGEVASDQLTAAETEATLSTEGSPSYAKLNQLLAGEASADQRARLYAAAGPVLDKLVPLAQKRREVVAQAVHQLGYDSLAQYLGGLRGVDAEALAAMAEKTLAATDELYTHTMDRLALDELALPLGKLHVSDLPRLFRSPANDVPYPWPQIMPAAFSLFRGLGLDVEKDARLHVDMRALVTKTSGPLCLPVDPPKDVRVSIKPRAGMEGLRDALFVLAQAEQELHVTRPEWELRALGPTAPSEGFALLFRDLADSIASPRPSDPAAQTQARHAAAQHLYSLRRDAALIQYALLLDGGPIQETPADSYRRVMSRAYGFSLTPDDVRRAPLEDDLFLDSAAQFVGRLLAAQISDHLVATYGDHWWTSEAAGRDIAALWANGHALTVEQVVAWSGSTAVDPTALVRRLAARLGP